MKKIVTIVGARPQFIKAAVISRLIRDEYKDSFSEILVHTGQHFDANMSDVFFKEMDIPKPDYNLNISSLSHGAMTGRMLEEIENVILSEKPDIVLVYGDTNSTLAGALAAAKLHIPVAHIEAGLRSFNMKMPEEINRILTDRVSAWLFCPTDTAVQNLKNEGQVTAPDSLIANVGDIMLDASLFYRRKLDSVKPGIEIPEHDFILCTLHRAENTDDPERLKSILGALNEISNDIQVILPLHPRTKNKIAQLSAGHSSLITNHSSFKIIDPVGFFDMLRLENACSMILTDSGGVQKEAYFFKKPCITMRDQTEWVETVEAGWNVIVGADKERICEAVRSFKVPQEWPGLYGNGDAGRKILGVIRG